MPKTQKLRRNLIDERFNLKSILIVLLFIHNEHFSFRSTAKMLRIVFVCTLIALALGATVPDATQDPDFLEWSGRIVGGTTATPGQFPYQTSMRSAANAHFCGGFIINTRWVGSAAHCTIGRTIANTLVVVGAHNRITGGDTRGVSRIINHPSYSSITLINDISVVELSTTLVWTATVQAIPLGSAAIGAGNAQASGWGQTSHPGSAAANLQWVPTATITNADCRSRLAATQAARVFDSTICTFTRDGEGMCMGDSGGPLTAGGQVIGAVSWGIPCGRGSPDMFARISSFRDWMISHTG